MVYESVLTPGNFGKSVANNHFYITSFIHELPEDVFGGSTKDKLAPRKMLLEYGSLRTETDIPTTKAGRPRMFFRDRAFVAEFFRQTRAAPGDVILIERVSLYHLRLSLRKARPAAA
jgi:hypothetical protein